MLNKILVFSGKALVTQLCGPSQLYFHNIKEDKAINKYFK